MKLPELRRKTRLAAVDHAHPVSGQEGDLLTLRRVLELGLMVGFSAGPANGFHKRAQ